jgi:hypothetical protein
MSLLELGLIVESNTSALVSRLTYGPISAKQNRPTLAGLHA